MRVDHSVQLSSQPIQKLNERHGHHDRLEHKCSTADLEQRNTVYVFLYVNNDKKRPQRQSCQHRQLSHFMFCQNVHPKINK